MSSAASVHIDQQLFREVTGHYPTGVAVVTGRDADGDILALVVGTFSSVSLDPPLVSFMPMKTSRTFDRMKDCTSLCINIVGGEQEREVLTIAQRWENKLDGIDWFASPSGDPVLADSIAWIDTRICETVEAGDHWIVLCAVEDMAVTNPVAPLIFFQGGYGSFVCTSLMARMDHEILPAIHAAHSARADVEALAARIGCAVSVFTAVSADEMAIGAVGYRTRRRPRRKPGAAHSDRPADRGHLPFRSARRRTGALDRQTPQLRGGREERPPRSTRLRPRARLSRIVPARRRAVGLRADARSDKTIRNGSADPGAGAPDPGIDPTHTCRLPDPRIGRHPTLRRRLSGHAGTRPKRQLHLDLRLAQLPPQATGETIKQWLDDARSVAAVLEQGGANS